MRVNRTLRRLFWLLGCAGVVVAAFGVGSGSLVLGVGGLLVAIPAIGLSLRKLTCPACGYAIRVVSYQARHCLRCGAAFRPDAG